MALYSLIVLMCHSLTHCTPVCWWMYKGRDDTVEFVSHDNESQCVSQDE